eukprot:1089-Eustigmatos_ZCMA.PRE.1
MHSTWLAATEYSSCMLLMWDGYSYLVIHLHSHSVLLPDAGPHRQRHDILRHPGSDHRSSTKPL